MEIVIHSNNWKWGRSFDLITDDGTGTVSVSITNDEPEQAYISGLSVHQYRRNQHLGSFLMKEAMRVSMKERARYAYLMVDKDSFVFDWYKRLGFNYYGHKPDENGFVPMYADLKTISK